MPCDSGPLTAADFGVPKLRRRLKTVKDELDLVTRLLCALCNNSSGAVIEKIENGELKTWWKEHQKLDAQREAREAKKKRDDEAKIKREERKKKLKTQALSKLSKKEREALGVK